MARANLSANNRVLLAWCFFTRERFENPSTKTVIAVPNPSQYLIGPSTLVNHMFYFVIFIIIFIILANPNSYCTIFNRYLCNDVKYIIHCAPHISAYIFLLHYHIRLIVITPFSLQKNGVIIKRLMR